MVVRVHRWAGFTYSTQRIPLSKMKRATLEASRPGSRIATRGGAVWPFGDSCHAKPNQYDVIDDINKFMGRMTRKVV
jgi:hypothetical protein